MAKRLVKRSTAKAMVATLAVLRDRHWDTARLVIPEGRLRGKLRRPKIRAVAVSGEVDIGLEISLNQFFGREMIKVHCAPRYGAGAGQIWCFGFDRPLPTVTEAENFLRKRCDRARNRSSSFRER